MAEIVNLRQARKRKRRDDKERAAAANRASHGRSASDKAKSGLERSLEEKRLDAHRREDRGAIACAILQALQSTIPTPASGYRRTRREAETAAAGRPPAPRRPAGGAAR